MLSAFQRASSLVFNPAPGLLISEKFLQKTFFFFFLFPFLFNLIDGLQQQQRPLACLLSCASSAASPVHDISVSMSRRWQLACFHQHSYLLLVSSGVARASQCWSMSALCPLLCCLLQRQRVAESQLNIFLFALINAAQLLWCPVISTRPAFSKTHPAVSTSNHLFSFFSSV